MSDIKYCFDPVFNAESRVLILGSFPSVKSRQIEFYYGNKQNRFWKTLCSFFNQPVPDGTELKRAFLLEKRVALWDIVAECEIDGSSDSSIKNYKVARLEDVLSVAPIELIILNGGKAFEIFKKYYPDILVPWVKLPSTSPANTRDGTAQWHEALEKVFSNSNAQ